MPNTIELVGASIFTVFCIVLARLYSLVNEAYNYWDRKNVKGPRPAYVYGTWKGLNNYFLGTVDLKNTKKYGKVYGTYDGLTPNLIVTDPQIIKEILDSSEEDFQDVRYMSENSVVLKDSLLSLSGGEKSEIQIFINSLMNGRNLEKLFPKLNASVDRLISNITTELQESDRVNITPVATEFVTDAVASAIFGIDLNADVQFKDEFVLKSKKIFSASDPESLMSLRFLLYDTYFKEFWICPEKTLQYFVNLILTEMSDSTAKLNSTEADEMSLIQCLVKGAKDEKESLGENSEANESNLVLKDSLIISKCIASMLSLLNATRTTVLLGIYALASNEDVQEKIYEEVAKKKSEELSLENFRESDYSEMFIKEVLRLYPFEFRLERITTKKTKLAEVELDKGTKVSVPLYALHRLEDFYTEPEKFDPGRFSENLSKGRNPFTYLPYGQAGINGSNFSIQLGILAAKLSLLRLVEKFQFYIIEEKDLSSLFKRGLTRIPVPQDIEVFIKSRI